MHKIMIAAAAVALLAAAPALAQTQNATPSAGASSRVGVTTDGVVPNPPAVNGSGQVTSDSTGAAATTSTSSHQTLDQRGMPKRGASSESTTGANAGAGTGTWTSGGAAGASASGSGSAGAAATSGGAR